MFGYDENKNIDFKIIEDLYAESLFKYIGAISIDSIDASDYEEASIIHDLNIPINNEYKSKYNLVLDSGSLEHIFNFPQAIKNCMELVKVGGHFAGFYPCNNFFGHGFYQFSSELFYRTFCKQNGFQIIDVILFVDEPDTNFYSVPDTDKIYQRIQFTNCKPVYMYVIAIKTSQVEILNTYPFQMDYAEIKWKKSNYKSKVIRKERKIKKFFPSYLKNLTKALFNIKYKDNSNFNKDYFNSYKLK